MRRKTTGIIGAIIVITFTLPVFVLAGPTSEHYELRTYGFGAGGITDASSSAYGMIGIAGEQAGNTATSSAYQSQPGLIFTQQANLPPAPTFTNPGSTYNRLKLVINPASNPEDGTFAVAITGDNWITTQYVKSDLTVGETLTNSDWMTYDDWGAALGRTITGLDADTTYRVKVKARSGDFTETGWSAVASAATVTPSLTFGISSGSIDFDALTSLNSWTDDSKSTVLTTSTNAYHGYTVFAHETDPLTDSYANTIDDYASPNSNPTAWTGLGFGYTTDDDTLAGGTADRFVSGGTKYAGFTTDTPGDPVADHSDPVSDTPITDETYTVTYRVTANGNTIAGQYKNTVLYIVVPEY